MNEVTQKPVMALDFDSTLAATSEVALDLICGPDHPYDYDDIESWDWGLEKFGTARFLSALWHTWTIRPLQVDPMEPNIGEKVESLRNQYEVHIVTANPDHMGIEEGKKQWLAEQGIEYDEYHEVPSQSTKADLRLYDVYVDDKPTLPGEVTTKRPTAEMFLRDHRYNRGVGGDYTRIESITEVLQ
jgi:5'(3')-deoxyribonucleotidase